MTREEAIKVLQKSTDNTIEMTIREWEEFDKKVAEAIDMAIEALSKPTGGDLISRAEAIRWVKTECNPYGKPTLDYDSGFKVIEHLKKMQSALPSARQTGGAEQGEWIWRTDIPIGDGRTSAGYICSNCGKDYWHGNVFNYCPSCGADMRGGEDE